MLYTILLLISLAQSKQADCKFTVGGKTYDLSPLDGKTATGDDSKISTYHYMAAVCSDMTTKCEDIMTGQKLTGVVYQMGGEPGQQAVCWDMLAKWGDYHVGPLDKSSGVDKDGFTLSFQNGDPCRGQPRKTKMNMICDSEKIGKVSGFQDDSDSCLFIINYPTSYACSGGPAPKTTAPAKSTPKPTTIPGAWGINGTFTGNMTGMSDTSNPDEDLTITIEGNCQNMGAVTEGSDGIEIWQISTTVCSGSFSSGTMKSEKTGKTYNFNAYLLIDSSPHQLELVIMNSKFPFQVVSKAKATEGKRRF